MQGERMDSHRSSVIPYQVFRCPGRRVFLYKGGRVVRAFQSLSFCAPVHHPAAIYRL